jgi:hypothetical protein
VLGRPVGDVGQAAGALGARCHIGDHLLEFHQADGLGLLDVHRGDDAVYPDFFVGDAGFIGKIEQLYAQGGAFVLIPGSPSGPHIRATKSALYSAAMGTMRS